MSEGESKYEEVMEEVMGKPKKMLMGKYDPLPEPNRLEVRIADLPWALARNLPDPEDGSGHTVRVVVDGTVVFEGKLESINLSVGKDPHRISSRGDRDTAALTAIAPGRKI